MKAPAYEAGRTTLPKIAIITLIIPYLKYSLVGLYYGNFHNILYMLENIQYTITLNKCVGCGELEEDCICGEKYETLEELIEQEENN